jgi:hypothetical protein
VSQFKNANVNTTSPVEKKRASSALVWLILIGRKYDRSSYHVVSTMMLAGAVISQ